MSLDSSTIDLCLSMFPWAKFRSTKGAIKLHVGLDHQGYLPTFLRVTDGKVHDMTIARDLELPAESIVVFDRGYAAYDWFNTLNSKGIFFVTRQKRGAAFTVVERRSVDKKQGLTCDQTIQIRGELARKCPIKMRRIGFRDPDTGKLYTFLTNNFSLSAMTIARIYQSRWQIELFFKWIKQNLKIKTFLGTSKNAVLTQVWIAMCVYLILSYIKFVNKLSFSLQQILRLLQLNLFERRDLMALLKPPLLEKNQEIYQRALSFV
jgi:putative transposase